MRSQQDVCFGFLLHFTREVKRLLKVVVLKQRNRELGEAVRVHIMLRQDHRESNRQERILLERRYLGTGSLRRRLGLVLMTATKEERRNHVSHQVGVLELDHI